MAIRVVRFGTAREPGEGPRLGTVRRPPRGVRKEDWSRRDYYDVWLPDLAPSAPLVSWITGEPVTSERWSQFARRYRAEMRAPEAQRLIAVLATLSQTADFAVGCYCEDAARCHRSLLRTLLEAAGAAVLPDEVDAARTPGATAATGATLGDSTTAARKSPRPGGTPRPPRRRAR
jgi:uncharacterized protein YeaO (DUF488 family)